MLRSHWPLHSGGLDAPVKSCSPSLFASKLAVQRKGFMPPPEFNRTNLRTPGDSRRGGQNNQVAIQTGCLRLATKPPITRTTWFFKFMEGLKP